MSGQESMNLVLTQDRLESVLQKLTLGNLMEAESDCLMLIEAFPEHPFAWKALGVLYQRESRFSQAHSANRRALQLSPSDAETWNNLGTNLQSLGELQQALDSFLTALQHRAEYPSAFYNMGNVLNKMGRQNEALECFIEAVRLNEDFVEAHHNLGILLKDLRRYTEAKTSILRAIELQPGVAAAHNNLGNVYAELGDYPNAQTAFNKALTLDPTYVDALINLGNVQLKRLETMESGERNLRKAIELSPRNALAYNQLGVALTLQRALNDAEVAFARAVELEPGFAEGFFNRGNTLRALGRVTESIACLEKAIEVMPDYCEAHRLLANSREYEPDDGHLDKLQQLYSSNELPSEQRAHICFALAKASADLRDFAAAFRLYAEGNAVKKQEANYDLLGDRLFFKKILAAYSRFKDINLKSSINPATVTPIYIVGMPRSGTSLVEQIISSHTAVVGAGEIPDVGYYGKDIASGEREASLDALLEFRSKIIHSLTKYAEGKQFVIDKVPLNFRYLGLISVALPEAKIIHVNRDPAAVCWANFEQYFPAKNLSYCYDLADTIEYFWLYRELMQNWKRALDCEIYELVYERLTENQESETKQLINYIELDWEPACLLPEKNSRSVMTASGVQIRQRVYQGSSNRWKNYQPYLNGILDQLSDAVY